MKNINIVIVLILVALTGVAIYNGIKKSDRQEKEISSRYASKIMPLSFAVPENYSVAEKNHLVSLGSKTGDGNISIHRIATNFNSVDDYIVDLSEMNKLKISAKSPVIIGGKDFRLIQYISGSANKKVYVTVNEGWAYTIESTTADMGMDLEAVAMSVEFIQ